MNRWDRSSADKTAKLLVLEWTTTQLIFWLCLFLSAIAGAFAIGIMVGRIDTSFERAATPEEEPKTATTETYTVPAFGQEEADLSGDASEADSKNQTARRTPEVSKPRSPYMDVTPRMTSLDPLPAQRSRPIQVEAPARAARPEGEAQTAAGTEAAAAPTEAAGAPKAALTQQSASPAPATPSAPPAAVQTAPAAVVAQTSPTPAPNAQETQQLTPIVPDEPPLLEPIAPPQQAPAQSAAPAGRGKFGIQLAAFTTADRQTRAATLQTKMAREKGVQAEVLPSPDGKAARVVVTGFATKEQAEGALQGIRTKTGIQDAYVRVLD